MSCLTQELYSSHSKFQSNERLFWESERVGKRKFKLNDDGASMQITISHIILVFSSYHVLFEEGVFSFPCSACSFIEIRHSSIYCVCCIRTFVDKDGTDRL